jgi:hypothetical protein
MKFSGWTPFPMAVLASDLSPTGNREGFHLGSVLDRMAKAMGETYPDSDPTARFVAGFTWETAVEYMHAGMNLDEAMDAAFRRYMIAIRKDVQTQVHLERDGIRATPDSYNPNVGEVESYKNSWRKIPATQAIFEDKFWRWVCQECSYAYLLGVDTVRWIVLWNRGNYSDIQGPVVMQATATWEPWELVENWRMVMVHAEAMKKEVV